MSLLRAYTVLQGGGVKGAALAGAVDACQRSGIAFDGFGGVSAGAIVSTLFAAGYTGADLREILLRQMHPRWLLDDPGHDETRLAILLRIYTDIRRVFGRRLRLHDVIRLWWRHRRAIAGLKQLSSVGLYSGRAFVNTLSELLRGSPVGKRIGDRQLTFEALQSAGAPKLKVIAANLSTGKAEPFDAEKTPTMLVVNAVRASISYPFVFEPYSYGDHYLADGGLASNSPVFLFREEHIRTGKPIIAIDLSEPERADIIEYDLREFLSDLASCALEASDRLFRELVPGVDVVTVEFARRIGTLNFNVTPDDIRSMFDWGAISAYRFLTDYQRLTIAKKSHEDQIRLLQSMFCPQKFVEPVLSGLKLAVERVTGARDVRISIALPLPIEGATEWIRCYQDDFSGPKQRRAVEDITDLKAIAACVEGGIGIVKFDDTSTEGLRYRPKSAAYFPIAPPDPVAGGDYKSLAVLQISTTTPLEETGWVTASKGLEDSLAEADADAYVGTLIEESFTNLGNTWSGILYALRSYNR